MVDWGVFLAERQVLGVEERRGEKRRGEDKNDDEVVIVAIVIVPPSQGQSPTWRERGREGSQGHGILQGLR